MTRTSNVVKDIQKMNGRLAALTRFMAKLAKKALPFFKILKKDKKFTKTEESKITFQKFKETLSAPLTLISWIQNFLPIYSYSRGGNQRSVCQR